MMAMAGLLVPGIISTVTELIKGNVADKAAAAQLQLVVESDQFKMQLQASIAQAASDSAQLKVDDTEAASDSKFKSFWRPGFGWLGLTICACHYLIFPFLVPILHYLLPALALPNLEISDIMPIIYGMLGLGAYRSYDKYMENKAQLDPPFQ